MLSLEKRKLVLEEIRLAINIGLETRKDAVNEGMDDIIEDEEMQEFWDKVVDCISYTLSDEVWEEDYEQEMLAEDDDEDGDLGSSLANHIAGIFD